MAEKSSLMSNGWSHKLLTRWIHNGQSVLSGTRPESNSRWQNKNVFIQRKQKLSPKNQPAGIHRTETGFSRAGGAERQREGNRQPPLRSRRSAGCEQRWVGGMPWRDEHTNSEKPGQRADQSPIEAGEIIKKKVFKNSSTRPTGLENKSKTKSANTTAER